MSVEASRWAMQADVLKSSSKLVLLNLAQLVRYDADDWTAFASIEYLAKVTHLNRKTVIDALARLREMGAIQDTGRRAGGNRSSVIYRLCPRAVPPVDLATAHTVAGAPTTTAQRRSSPELHLEQEQELDFDLTPEVKQSPALDEAADDGCAQPATTGSHPDLDRSDDAAAVTPQGPTSVDVTLQPPAPLPPDAGLSQREPEFAVMEPSAGAAKPGRGRARATAINAAGAGGTRLPSGWALPEKWRLWTHQNRPQWTEERVDAMAATFSAYWRSRVGDAAFSADWFESWRLWVFREHAPEKGRGKPWQESWSGIVAKGKSLSLYRAPNEPEAYFKLRVFDAAGVPPPH